MDSTPTSTLADESPQADGEPTSHHSSAPLPDLTRASGSTRRKAASARRKANRYRALEQVRDQGFLGRDSAKDPNALAKGLATTYAAHLDDPEVAPIAAVAHLLVQPTQEGQRLREKFGAQALHHTRSDGSRGFVGWLILRTRTWHLFAPASAALENDDETNDYIEVTARIHTEYPVREWVVGSSSRPVRAKALALPLERALMRNRTIIVSDTGRIDLSTGEGRLAWDAITLTNDWVLKSTVKQLKGRTYEHIRDGMWIRGDWPIGYVRPEDQDYIFPIDTPATRAQVNAIRESVFWPGCAEQVLRRLGVEYGIRASHKAAKTLRKEHPERDFIANPALVHEVRHPASALRRLWGDFELYRDGFELDQEALAGSIATEWSGDVVPGRNVPIHTDPDTGIRLIVGHRLAPLPPGGWATTEQWNSAITRRDERQAEHAARRTQRRDRCKPLAGLGRWSTVDPDGTEWQWYLNASRPTTYEVLRREADGDASWKTNRGTLMATVRAGELHRVVAAAIRRAVDGDLSVIRIAESLDLTTIADPEHHATELLQRKRSELAAAEKTAAGATTALAALGPEAHLDETDKVKHRLFSAAADTAASEVVALQRQLDAMLIEADLTVATTQTGVDVFTLAALVVELEAADAALPLAVNHAAKELLGTSLRVTPVSAIEVDIAFALRLPTKTGSVELGPITATALNNITTLPEGTAALARADALAQLFFTGNGDLPALAARGGWAEANCRRILVNWIGDRVPNAGLRTALTTCPIPEVRQALWNHWTGQTPTIPIDSAFANHIVATYCQPEWPWGNTWAMGVGQRREAVEYVRLHSAANRDAGVSQADLDAALGLARRDTAFFSRRADVSSGRGRPVLPVLERTTAWLPLQPDEDKRVRLPLCPHCGLRIAPAVIRTPETPACWICPTCRRMPGSDLEFPPAYLQAWTTTDRGARIHGTAARLAVSDVRQPSSWDAELAGARRRRQAKGPRRRAS